MAKAYGLALLALALAVPAAAQPVTAMTDDPCAAAGPDWAAQCRYAADNARVDPAHPPRAVFIGDSITENWAVNDPTLFGAGVLNRGISGQTSPQLLVRFWQDVVALHPRVVHIMAGTNDLAGNTGPTSPTRFKDTIRAMVALARANGIAVVLGSIPPADRFSWQPVMRPAAQIAKLNAWLKDFAEESGCIFADYHAVLANPDDALKPEFGPDGVHPSLAGYAAMRPVADAALAAAEHIRQATKRARR